MQASPLIPSTLSTSRAMPGTGSMSGAPANDGAADFSLMLGGLGRPDTEGPSPSRAAPGPKPDTPPDTSQDPTRAEGTRNADDDEGKVERDDKRDDQNQAQTDLAQAQTDLAAWLAGVIGGQTDRLASDASKTAKAAGPTTEPVDAPAGLKAQAHAAMMEAAMTAAQAEQGALAALADKLAATDASPEAAPPLPVGAAAPAGPSGVLRPAAGGLRTGGVDVSLQRDLHHPEFVPAFSARVAMLVRDGVEQARVHLNPAEMGPVSLQMSLDGQRVRVEMMAELAATRQVLEHSLPSLASALRDAGFTLHGGGVSQHPSGRHPQDVPRGEDMNERADDGSSAAELTVQVSAQGAIRTSSRQHLVDMFA
ncbi:MAG: flagellar hook-length control protein FliK [Rubrivivax sp.]